MAELHPEWHQFFEAMTSVHAAGITIFAGAHGERHQFFEATELARTAAGLNIIASECILNAASDVCIRTDIERDVDGEFRFVYSRNLSPQRVEIATGGNTDVPTAVNFKYLHSHVCETVTSGYVADGYQFERKWLMCTEADQTMQIVETADDKGVYKPLESRTAEPETIARMARATLTFRAGAAPEGIGPGLGQEQVLLLGWLAGVAGQALLEPPAGKNVRATITIDTDGRRLYGWPGAPYNMVSIESRKGETGEVKSFVFSVSPAQVTDAKLSEPVGRIVVIDNNVRPDTTSILRHYGGGLLLRRRLGIKTKETFLEEGWRGIMPTLRETINNVLGRE